MDQQRQILKWVHEAYKANGEQVPRNLRITWSRMRAALGKAVIRPSGPPEIRLSKPLWPEMTEEKRCNTVKHEACHHIIGVAGAPHGAAWRRAMIRSGERPERVDTTVTAYETPRPHRARCVCRVHHITARRRGMMRRGRRYRCPRCLSELEVIA